MGPCLTHRTDHIHVHTYAEDKCWWKRGEEGGVGRGKGGGGEIIRIVMES